MSRILVVAYRENGPAGTFARQLARACSADLEFIEEAEPEADGALVQARLAFHAFPRRSVPIQDTQCAPRGYDLVVIGTPVFARNVPGPVRTYVARHRGQFRRVALFCTGAGAGHEKVLRDLAALCGRPAAVALGLADDDILTGRHQGLVTKFAGRLLTCSRLSSQTSGFGRDAYAERRQVARLEENLS